MAPAPELLQEVGGLTASAAQYSLGVGFHFPSVVHINLPLSALQTAKPQIALIHVDFFVKIQGLDAKMAIFEIAIQGRFVELEKNGFDDYEV